MSLTFRPPRYDHVVAAVMPILLPPVRLPAVRGGVVGTVGLGGAAGPGVRRPGVAGRWEGRAAQGFPRDRGAAEQGGLASIEVGDPLDRSRTNTTSCEGLGGMKRVLVILVTLLMLLSPAVPWLVPARAQDKEKTDFPVPVLDADAVREGAKQLEADEGKDWYIVTLKDRSVDPGAVADELTKSQGLVVGHVYRYALRGFSAKIPAEVLPVLRKSGVVETIAPVEALELGAQVVPNGPHRIEVAPSSKNAQAGVAGDGGNIDVDVAVVDSGIDKDQADLNYAGGSSFVGAGADCTGGNSPGNDALGHGTRVAGIIAAKDNDKGIVGVAPGARVWSVKVINSSNWFYTANLICAVDYLTDHADVFEVANLSLGKNLADGDTDDGNCGYTNGSDLHKSICAAVGAGVTFVVAAMNDCTNANRREPASYDEVITVSAMIDTDGLAGALGPSGIPVGCNSSYSFNDNNFAPFSNFGADIDLSAPGVDIVSTASGGGTNSGSGTSFSAPFVAGAAALYKAANPTWTPAQVRSTLIAQREQVALSGDPDGTNEGVLNLNDGAPWPDTTPPTNTLSISESEDDEYVDGTGALYYNNGNGHSGAFTVTATVTDTQSGIQQVEFPSLFGEGGIDTSSPYSETYTWNDNHNASGSRTVTAWDTAGFWSIASFAVYPDHAGPSVSITSPVANQTVSGTATVVVSASDGDSGVAGVTLRYCPGSSSCGANQGTVIGTDTSAPYQVNWDTTTLPDGNYKLRARATDNVGNETDSATVLVTVGNGSSLMGGSANGVEGVKSKSDGSSTEAAPEDSGSGPAAGSEKKHGGHCSKSNGAKGHSGKGKHQNSGKHGDRGGKRCKAKR